jgi:hypothetical protein
VYLEQVHSVLYIPIPLSLFQCYAVSLCIYVTDSHPLHSSVSFPSPHPFLWFPSTIPHIHSSTIIIIIGSTNGSWPFEPGLSCLTWWTPVPSIFLQMTSFHFSLWLSNIPGYVYTYTYIHIYIYIYIYTHTHTHICTCISYFLYPFFCFWA